MWAFKNMARFDYLMDPSSSASDLENILMTRPTICFKVTHTS